MAKLSSVDRYTSSYEDRKELSLRLRSPNADSESESDTDSDSEDDSEDDSIQQVLGGIRRKNVIKDEEEEEKEKDEVEGVKVAPAKPLVKSKPWGADLERNKNKENKENVKEYKQVKEDLISKEKDSQVKVKPWHRMNKNENQSESVNKSISSINSISKSIESLTIDKKESDDIVNVMKSLSISTDGKNRKDSNGRKEQTPVLSSQQQQQQLPRKPKPSNPALRPFNQSNRAPNRTPIQPTHTTTQPNHPPNSIKTHTTNLNNQPSADFFQRLQKAKQKQNNNLVNPPRPTSSFGLSGFPSSSLPQPSGSLTTFGSPVRKFNNGSLMEPMTPKSSQWSRPVDLSRANARPIPIGSSLKFPDDEEISVFSKPTKWGTSTSSLAEINTRVLQGNSHSYSDPKEAVKDLLSNLNQDDDGEDGAVGDGVVGGLDVTLLPHQIKGLKFLLQREGNDVQKGGLLCDDMGLGKTVQSIALILSNRYKGKDDSDLKDNEGKSKNTNTSKSSIKTTLVIAPLALAEQWADEIRTKAPGLRVIVHHGSSRAKNSLKFNTYDVIVTTFQILTSEHANDGPLFDRTWWRVIIDEAHTIKNHKAKSSIACCSLQSHNRWCLTGTPIQNNVDELYSLFKFLQIKPLDDQINWRNQITKPMSTQQNNVAVKRLHVILSAIMLRRTKVILKKSGINLPERRKHIVHLEFDHRERSYYDDLYNQVSETVKSLLSESGRNYIGALTMLLRLRQICDDIRLATKQLDIDDKESVITAATAGKSDADDLADLLGDLNIDKEEDYIHEVGNKSNNNLESTKIKKVIEIVGEGSKRKTIVFSQFTSMLDLMEPSLRRANINFVRYDGKMTKAHRETSLRRLKEDSEVEVLLCSLKCGAYGLNLTCANRVVLLDPWWNPMVGEQAIDRVHRLGQTHDVDVYELIIKNSVEEKIMELQEKKRKLSKEIIEGDAMSSRGSRLGFNELMSLFS